MCKIRKTACGIMLGLGLLGNASMAGDTAVRIPWLEDNLVPNADFEEIELDSDRARALLGKRLGETIVLAKGTMQDRLAKIVQITGNSYFLASATSISISSFILFSTKHLNHIDNSVSDDLDVAEKKRRGRKAVERAKNSSWRITAFQVAFKSNEKKAT